MVNRKAHNSRTISDPSRRTALSVVVTDGSGTADLLSLYNINIGLDDDVFLPRGTYIAIRAPYYKLGAAGNYALRADHPSDVVKLHASHSLVTQFLKNDEREAILDHDSSTLKEEGNVLFRCGDYDAAIAKYSVAIGTSTLLKGSEVWTMLYCNRALARLRKAQFDGAIRDCKEVMQRNPEHPKASFLKGCALYGLRRYEEACECFHSFLAKHAASEDGKRHMLSTLNRLEESASGNFDFKKMQREANSQLYPRLDYGDYVGPLEIRQCNVFSRGRGLFATRDIAQGELILCEKALAIVYAGEIGFHATINTVKNRVYMGTDSYLPSRIVQLLFDNPSVASRYLELYSGGRHQPGSGISFTAEGDPIIDSFTVAAILDYNAFKPEKTPDLMGDTDVASKPGEAETDAGIWMHASYLNHSCTGNVFRTFIGDFMIIRALRSITSGEELHHSYVPPLDGLEERETVFSKYGFRCSCELCQSQRGTPKKELRLRKKATQIFQEFADQIRAQSTSSPRLLISRARTLVKNIRKTSSNPKFCVDLLEPYALLSALQYSAGNKAQCVSDLREIITLVSGADASRLDRFEPTLWTPELMLLLLTLCVVLEDIGSTQEVLRCKEICRKLYGIVTGMGYEAASIDDIMKLHRKRLIA